MIESFAPGPRISTRAELCPASPIRKLTPFADAAKHAGKKVYHLNIGQPDIPTPPEFWHAINTYQEQVLAYGPSGGLQPFRCKLTEYYRRFGITLTPKDILVTTGGSEAIIFAFMAVMDPGDEVIIPEPFYTNYNGFSAMTSVKVVPIMTHVEDGFRLPSREAFEACFGERTRAIMVCNPGNPTGVVYTREEIAMLIDLARERNVFLITDEVYREFVFDGLTHVSALEFPEAHNHVIVVDSISKRYSACGARIGFLVSRNQEIMSSCLKFGQARLCPPTLEQIGAIAAVDIPETVIAQMIDEYKCRRDVVYRWLTRMPGVVCKKPSGAFYCIARLPVRNAEEFALWLLSEYDRGGETVMIAPADGFYATPGAGRDEIRIAYVLNCEALERAMNLLSYGLEQYRMMEQR